MTPEKADQTLSSMLGPEGDPEYWWHRFEVEISSICSYRLDGRVDGKRVYFGWSATYSEMPFKKRLEIAAKHDHEKVLVRLAKSCVRVLKGELLKEFISQRWNGRGLLVWAIRADDLPFLEQLVDLGLSLHSEHVRGEKPIHIASYMGRVQIVRWIVRREPALVHARSQEGTTPLVMACEGGSEDVVKYLLKKGAVATVVNERGWGGEVIADHFGHERIANRIRTAVWIAHYPRDVREKRYQRWKARSCQQ